MFLTQSLKLHMAFFKLCSSFVIVTLLLALHLRKLAIEKDAVTAPIAGRIVLLTADVGQKVEKGECICILEAMKMENEVAAPKAGVVKEIRVSEGAIVNKGDILAVIT